MIKRYDVFSQDLYPSEGGDFVSYEDYSDLHDMYQEVVINAEKFAEEAVQNFDEIVLLQQRIKELETDCTNYSEFLQYHINRQVEAEKRVEELEDSLSGEKIARSRLVDALRDAGQELALLKSQEAVGSFLLIDGEYHQLADEYSESPDAVTLYKLN